MQTFTKLAMLAACVAVSLASADLAGDSYAYPQYKYNYGVADKKTGDIKEAEEYRDGGVTKGSYSLLQPDGLVRTVKYVADPKGGFQAKVLYSKGVGLGGLGGYGLGNGALSPVGVRYGGAIGAPVATGVFGGYGSPLGVGLVGVAGGYEGPLGLGRPLSGVQNGFLA